MGLIELSLQATESGLGASTEQDRQSEMFSEKLSHSCTGIPPGRLSDKVRFRADNLTEMRPATARDEAAITLNAWVADQLHELSPDDIATLLIFGRPSARNHH